MNRFFWLLNGALLSIGLLVTFAAVRYEPTAPPGPKTAGATADDARPGKTAGNARQPSGPALARGPTPEMIEQIWKQSLFRPDRGEDSTEGGTAENESARTTDMELVGIGQINGEGAAIILLQNGAGTPRRRLDTPDLPGSAAPFGRRPGTISRRPATGGRPDGSKGDINGQTHIFRVNQRVATSGFVVKEVKIDTVVLSRGGEERVLKLDRNDPNSKARQETASREAVARVPVAPPPPPVPTALQPPSGAGPNSPPTFVAPGQTGTAGTPGVFPSREERIRAAIGARRRQMEALQQQNNSPHP